MSLTVEAIYEGGVLKPTQPLALREHEKVRVTIDSAVDAVRRTAGLLGWPCAVVAFVLASGPKGRASTGLGGPRSG